MNATNPAELKTLFESDAFARETTYTGPLGPEYAPSGTRLVQVQTQYYTDPKYVLLSLAVTAILAVLGCMISNKLIVKHFRKSGAIK